MAVLPALTGYTSLSLDGGIVEPDAAPAMQAGDAVHVELERFPLLRCTVESVSYLRKGVAMKVRFTLEGGVPRTMVKRHTGRYSQDIRALDKSAIASGLRSRLFGRATRAAT